MVAKAAKYSAGGGRHRGIPGDYDDWNERRFSLERCGDGVGLAAIPGAEWVGIGESLSSAEYSWRGIAALRDPADIPEHLEC